MKHIYLNLGRENSDLNRFLFYVINDEWLVTSPQGEETAGLDLENEGEPDADLEMPNLDGMELVEWIQKQDDLRGLPVVGNALDV